MSKRPRRNHSPAFKRKAALAPVRGEKTLTELAQHFDVHPDQITQWRSQLWAAPPASLDRRRTRSPPQRPIRLREVSTSLTVPTRPKTPAIKAAHKATTSIRR